jgi:hypothetical protein
MNRQTNTTGHGTSFDPATIEAIWRKGQVVPGYEPSTHRKDACGAWMQKTSYGTTGDFGWEIDHIRPVAKGGTDDLTNLQPLQWQNNRHKGDDYPHWSCAVRSKS